MARFWKTCYLLSCGGVTCGFLQGVGLINFSQVLASFLTTILSLLVTILFGGNASTFLTGLTGSGSLVP